MTLTFSEFNLEVKIFVHLRQSGAMLVIVRSIRAP